MTVSHLTRSRDQLWSDLLVALGGSEAFLSRSRSERKILLEILETYGSSVSLLRVDDVDALLAAVVNAAGGTASHLRQTKHEMLAALVTALGGTAPLACSSSTGELLAACVNAVDTGGGGGGTPEWVPANAKIYIDLIAPGRAWTEDDGEVAINTLLGADANTENGWGTTGYNAANITADGYVSSTPVAYLGPALSKVLSGSTWVVRFKRIDSDPEGSFFVGSAAGNQAIELDFSLSSRNVEASSYGGSASGSATNIINKGVEGAINVVAMTLTSSRLEFSANGSDAGTASITTDDYPVSGDSTFVAALVDSGGSGNAIQAVTIYDALPGTTGLSELSETGVTNTAPIVVDPNFFNSTFSMADIAGLGDPPIIGLVVLDGGGANTDWVGDPEGNPIVSTSFVSGDAGFSVGDNGGASILFFDFSGKGVGDYHFTLRATDPGGLYVEQEFTITVTA